MSNDKWIQAGQFSLLVPVNWNAREFEEFTEFAPELGDAAVQITFYRRLGGILPTRESAARLVHQFADRNDLRINVEKRSMMQNDNWKYSAEFKSDKENNMPEFWYLSSVLGEHGAIVASLCSDTNQSKSYSEGVDILESIELRSIGSPFRRPGQ